MSLICVICLEPLAANSDEELVSIALRCGHLLHQGCALQWFLKRRTCPYCNKAIQLNRALRIYPVFDTDTDDLESDNSPPRTTPTITNENVEDEEKLKEKLKDYERLKCENIQLMEKVRTLETSNKNLRKANKALVKNALEEDKKRVKKISGTVESKPKLRTLERLLIRLIELEEHFLSL